MTYATRRPNLVDQELRRRNGVIARWNMLLWPLGVVALAVWALMSIAR